MTLPWGLELLFSNIGMSMQWTILLISTLSTLPFFAKDFKLGLIILMGLQAAIFVWFYSIGIDFIYNLTVFFIALILLALSLFAVNATSSTGGFN